MNGRVACAILIPLLAVGGCPADTSGPVAVDAGAADVRPDGAFDTAGLDRADANADSDDSPTWDPVWHETTPKDWKIVAAADPPDCGPGCRLVLGSDIGHPSFYGLTFTRRRIVDVGRAGLMFAGSEGTVTRVEPGTVTNFLLEPYVAGDYVSFVSGVGLSIQVEVMSLVTGERKVAYTVVQPPGDGGISLTALSSTHVYWTRFARGMMSLDLRTGEIRLSPGDYACSSICATESGVICPDIGDGVIWFFDLDGKRSLLDKTGALQADGNCSPDRDQIVWVDYRDPPGPGSNYDHRSGGEIYVRDFATGISTRLTFDSPAKPRAKGYPAIDGDVVVWSEPPLKPGVDPNPSGLIYSSIDQLVMLDRKTGKKCRVTANSTDFMGFRAVIGRHLFAYNYFNKRSDGQWQWLVDIDLDAPNFTWSCDS